jgi:hypothetical protein
MAPQTKSEFWYGFSNYFPKDYITDPTTEIVNQWQAFPDLALGEKWRSPPLAIEIKNNHFVVAVRWSNKRINTTEDTQTSYFDIGEVKKEQWLDWVVHVKWTPTNQGILEVWQNDQLVLKRVSKPIGYYDSQYPYFKIGIYKWEWNNATTSTAQNRSYYIDEVRVGDMHATYKDVKADAKKAPTANATPIANPGADRQICEGCTLTLDGRPSVDPDGQIERYRWEFVTGPSVIKLSNPLSPVISITNMIVGKYRFRLTVTDDKGKNASDVVDISVVKSSSKAPTAIAQVDSTTKRTNNTIFLDGRASAAYYGKIVTYRWKKLAGPGNEYTWENDTPLTRFQFPESGKYVFLLTVTDNNRLSDSDTMSVILKATQSGGDLKIYPNPVINRMKISISYEGTGPLTVNIFNSEGRLVRRQQYIKGGTSFDDEMSISGLNRGIYFVQVLSMNMNYSTKVMKMD